MDKEKYPRIDCKGCKKDCELAGMVETVNFCHKEKKVEKPVAKV